MTTILIKPKSKSEYNLLTRLLKKMNIEIQVVEESMSHDKTQKSLAELEDTEYLSGSAANENQILKNMAAEPVKKFVKDEFKEYSSKLL